MWKHVGGATLKMSSEDTEFSLRAVTGTAVQKEEPVGRGGGGGGGREGSPLLGLWWVEEQKQGRDLDERSTCLWP